MINSYSSLYVLAGSISSSCFYGSMSKMCFLTGFHPKSLRRNLGVFQFRCFSTTLTHLSNKGVPGSSSVDELPRLVAVIDVLTQKVCLQTKAVLKKFGSCALCFNFPIWSEHISNWSDKTMAKNLE